MNAGNLVQSAGGTLGMGAGLSSLGLAMGPLGWAGLAALNLLPAIIGGNQQAKQRRQEAMMRAAEIEASPWTGRGATTQVSTPQSNVWANLLGAGANVIGQGAAIEKARRDAAMNEMLMQRMQEAPMMGAGQPMGWMDLMKMQQLTA
jgi:hypothetical protein